MIASSSAVQPEVVDVIDVDLGLEQLADDFDVSSIGGADQPGAVEAVEAGDICAVLQSELEELEVALGGGDEVGALDGVVLRVDVRAFLDEPPRLGEVVLPGGGDELPVQGGCSSGSSACSDSPHAVSRSSGRAMASTALPASPDFTREP